MTPTSVDLDELVRMHSDDQCPLDQWGRYKIIPEGGKVPKPHARVTSVAKIPESTFNIERWATRCTVKGLLLAPHLWTKLCGVELDDDRTIDAICGDAKVAGGGDEASTIGTAIHVFSDRADRGLPTRAPARYEDDILAYRAELDRRGVEIIPELIERYLVLPDIAVAGKCDRIVRFGSSLKIADLKTGRDLSYAAGSISMQLAMYSRAKTIYNPATKTHEPMPDVDQDIGLVFHLPAGQARCTIYFVDLNAGWEMVDTALRVKAWRSRRDLMQPWVDDAPVVDLDVRRARLLERGQVLREIPGALAMLAAAWPEGVPGLKGDHRHSADELDLIALALSTVEAKTGAPFGALDPADAVSAPTHQTKENL